MAKVKAMRFLLYVLAIGAIAGASFALDNHEVKYTYFSNSTLTTWVGEQDFDCDNFETDYGSLSSYRTVDVWRCSDGLHQVHNCQEFDYATQSWINITCP